MVLQLAYVPSLEQRLYLVSKTCLDLVKFDEQVADADLVIVGEGRLDSQSLAGKAPIGVAKRTPMVFQLLLFVVVYQKIYHPYHLRI